MKKIFTLLIVFCGLFAVLNAQTALDPNQFVNAQITEAGVYTVEPGQFYAFDGRIDLTFEITIEGPDNTWVMEADNLPVLLGTPAADGSARDFFEIKEGGGLTIKNVMLSGTHSNDEIISTFARNTGGGIFIVDNCVLADWSNFALRNTYKGGEISVTNCVFINGVRLRYSQWGGFPMRLDVAPDKLTWENNTAVNTGRLLANSGPFHNADITQMHNTYINHIVGGEEQRANEFMIANNIFYNYHWIGRKNETAVNPSVTYDAHFTTWNYFADSKDALDSISLYLGQNLFFRPNEITDWFATNGGDTLSPSLLWEHPDVDSFIIADDNYTIGTNYADIEPGFTSPPGNLDAIVGNLSGHYYAPTEEWVDWRIESPISYGDDGLPLLDWPPAFDLSYSNEGLQSAGTDGLPLGDLNWFPAKKAEYLANRDAIMESIRDSMVNATAVYDPNTMDKTPMITEITVGIEQVSIESMDVYVYPNPARDMISVYGVDQAGSTITFYDMLGKEIQFIQLEGSSSQLDISDLNKGVYLYRINTADNVNVKAGKLMIME